jgi:hypothetical protein
MWPGMPRRIKRSTTIVFVGVKTGKVFLGERPTRQRKTSRAEPGIWGICSGQGDVSLATGPGNYWVSSDKSSTIFVEVYDSNNAANPQDLGPNGQITMSVTGGLFLRPKPPDSGTANGEFALS